MAEAEGDEPFVLGIAAEGTRSRGEYWKSGFYRIAQQTGLPITLAFLDASVAHGRLGTDLLADRRRAGRHGPHPGVLRRQDRAEARRVHSAAIARRNRFLTVLRV